MAERYFTIIFKGIARWYYGWYYKAGGMTQREKLIERMRRRPSDMSFDDVCKVLEEFGWTLDRENKHTTFTKPGEFPIGLAKVSGKTVKRTYLVEICKRLGLDD